MMISADLSRKCNGPLAKRIIHLDSRKHTQAAQYINYLRITTVSLTKHRDHVCSQVTSISGQPLYILNFPHGARETYRRYDNKERSRYCHHPRDYRSPVQFHGRAKLRDVKG